MAKIHHGRELVPPDARAWAEIDLKALRHNVAELKSRLPETCGIMAIVKADAYGHGAVRMTAELRRMGVNDFAVATVAEAVELRSSGLVGGILVIGYTRPEDAHLLSRYDLTQMAIDAKYAKALSETGKKINVHVAVDTGMRRLGIDALDFDGIESVFKNLTVTGMATHLSSADTLDERDREFTQLQLSRFFGAVKAMRDKGYDTGKLHIQASYGIYNYPGLVCDYARAGIALYGMMSHNAETGIKPDLRPVLSLKARIAEVRWIDAGESVSYGRLYTAPSPIKLATVSIGYADGVPRQITGNGGECLVRSCRAPIVGRVCMDLLMLDVTGIEDVEQGDIVTLIGSDGEETVRCEDFAEQSGTITNDILCRLGKRLPRVYIDG